MKVSVNILTWNCINTLLDTIEVLTGDLKGITHEIIIVDNGSNDGCEDIATITNAENKGVSIGKNQGIDASQGEYIFMLDGDIVPVQNSVNLLLDWLEKNPKEYAIGFYPNKFNKQHNTNINNTHHEEYCHVLYEPKIHTQSICFYGMFRASLFTDLKVRFSEEGPFGECGYGWEDSDLYMQMRERGINQWVAGINTQTGRYYHEINSSIRNMGENKYINSSKARRETFEAKWGDKEKLYYAR